MSYLCYLYLCTYTAVHGELQRMIFVSFSSNTTGGTSGAGAAYHSGAPEFLSVL